MQTRKTRYNKVFFYGIGLRFEKLVLASNEGKMVSKKKELFHLDIEDYKEMLENFNDSVQIVSNDCTMLWMNKASNMEGVPRENLIGENVNQLKEKGYYSDVVSPKVLKEKKTVTIVASGKNGKEMLLTGTPIFKGDKIDKVIIISRDITELVRLENEYKKTEALAMKFEEELDLLKRNQIVSDHIIFKSEKMIQTLAVAKHVARTDATVLITGESGVGKGVVGRFIHENSSRKNMPCIKIDCGSIPEHLLESELFGYEAGSFTGALKSGKIGLFQAAHGGTVLLDEIAELPLHLQSKILNVVQDRKLVRVGGIETIPIDIRIIAMTNKDLSKMVELGSFRQDLFYRLNVVPILIPPLCQRKEDIIPLVLLFLNRLNDKYGEGKSMDPEVLDLFLLYDWPGNVRELENIVEMLLAISTGAIIKKDHLPKYLKEEKLCKTELPVLEGRAIKELMEEFEESIFRVANIKFGTIHEMSQNLKLDRSTVRKKMKKYGIK